MSVKGRWIAVLLLIAVTLTVMHAEFVATHDWQEVPDGQPIPPGLHVRMDMQTGKKLAKLWEREEKQGNKPEIKIVDKTSTAVEVVESKVEEDELESTAPKLSADEWAEVLEVLGMRRESPLDLFAEMYQKLASGELAGKENELKDLLEEMEDAIRDVDLARAFVDIGGIELFERLIPEYQDKKDFQAILFAIIGSASQNNRYVCYAVNDSQILKLAFDALKTSVSKLSSDELVENEDIELANRAFYAVSSVLRACTEAKSYYILHSELRSVLKTILESRQDRFLKMQRTAVGLIRNFVQNRLYNETSDLSLADPEIVFMSNEWCLSLLRLAADKEDYHILDNSINLVHALQTYDFCKSVSSDFDQKTSDSTEQGSYTSMKDYISSFIEGDEVDENEEFIDLKNMLKSIFSH